MAEGRKLGATLQKDTGQNGQNSEQENQCKNAESSPKVYSLKTLAALVQARTQPGHAVYFYNMSCSFTSIDSKCKPDQETILGFTLPGQVGF